MIVILSLVSHILVDLLFAPIYILVLLLGLAVRECIHNGIRYSQDEALDYIQVRCRRQGADSLVVLAVNTELFTQFFESLSHCFFH